MSPIPTKATCTWTGGYWWTHTNANAPTPSHTRTHTLSLSLSYTNLHKRTFTQVRSAVRMSCGVPGIYVPYPYQGHLYVDGGLLVDTPAEALPAKNSVSLMLADRYYLCRHYFK